MAGDTIQLRACRMVDITAVLALWRRAEAVPRPTDNPEALRVRLERDADLFVLAWDGDRLVGTLMGGWDGWRGNVYRLAVDPAARRVDHLHRTPPRHWVMHSGPRGAPLGRASPLRASPGGATISGTSGHQGPTWRGRAVPVASDLLQGPLCP